MHRTQAANTARLQALLARLSRNGLVIRLLRLAVWLTVPRQRIGAGLVLFDARGRVLLLRHVFHGRSPWGLPGGWLNRNEDPAAGALRELYEETGLHATLGPIVIVEHVRRWSAIEVVFVGLAPQGTLKLSFEIREARWCDPDDLPADMLLKTKYTIQNAYRLWQETTHSGVEGIAA